MECIRWFRFWCGLNGMLVSEFDGKWVLERECFDLVDGGNFGGEDGGDGVENWSYRSGGENCFWWLLVGDGSGENFWIVCCFGKLVVVSYWW